MATIRAAGSPGGRVTRRSGVHPMAWAAGIAVLMAVGAGAWVGHRQAPLPFTVASAPAPAPPSPPEAAHEPAPPLEAAPAQAPAGRRAPGLVLVAQSGDTMPMLYAQVYRGLVPPAYADFVALNQGPLRPGALVVFPTPPMGWPAH